MTTPEDNYFATNPAPSTLETYSNLASTFIDKHQPTRPIVLVTSGGTTVPLETNTVRVIDNFSAGTRGATSAEYFLSLGYAVIFLHRTHSLRPFSRHYSHGVHCFLDYLQTGPNGNVEVDSKYQEEMREVLEQYAKVKTEGTLLSLRYTTVNEYTWLLRGLAELLRPLERRACFYLAAAVSDFFIPQERMAEHKIQSATEFSATGDEQDAKARPAAQVLQDGSMTIELEPVPKFLKSLVDSWAPEAMIVSFKLETDPDLLSTKAKYALNKYQHHLVIGNLLTTRKWEVLLVSQMLDSGEKWIRVPRARLTSANNSNTKETILGDPTVEIESLICPEVKRLHEQFIAQQSAD